MRLLRLPKCFSFWCSQKCVGLISSLTAVVPGFPRPGSASQGSDLPSASVSTSSTSTPSPSPSSPIAHPAALTQPSVEFINPGDLSASALDLSAAAPSAFQFPPLPTLSAEDEEHKFTLVSAGSTASPILAVAEHT